MSVRTVRCPNCRTPVEWSSENRFRPFCSQRCRTIDLGAWAAEEYTVPAAETDPSEHETGTQDNSAGRPY